MKLSIKYLIIALIVLAFSNMAVAITAKPTTGKIPTAEADTSIMGFKLWVSNNVGVSKVGSGFGTVPGFYYFSYDISNLDSSWYPTEVIMGLIEQPDNSFLSSGAGSYSVSSVTLLSGSGSQPFSPTFNALAEIASPEVAQSGQHISVTWQAAVGPPSTSLISGYNVYRTTSATFGTTPINASLIPFGTNNYIDINGSPGQAYKYAVKIVFSGGMEQTFFSKPSVSINYPNIPPAVSANPTALTFNGMVGEANPAAQDIAITNSGGGTLNWTATKSSSWLTIPPSGGTGAFHVSVNIAGLTADTYHDTITMTAEGGNTITIPVTLNVVAVNGITIAPDSVTLYDGQSSPAFIPTVHLSGNTTATLSTTFESIPAGKPGSFNPANGIYTAPATISADDSFLVTANYLGQSGTATINLKKKALQSVTISPLVATLEKGASTSFTAIAYYNNGSQESITNTATWDSNVGTVTNGTLTANQGGAGTVTVSYMYGGVTKTDQANVTVIYVDHITMTPTAATMYDNQTQAFTVTAYLSNGTSREVTITLDKNSASGHFEGMTYFAPATIAADEPVTITANYMTKQATAQVSLIAKKLQSMTVSPTGFAQSSGPVQLTTNATYNNNAQEDVTSKTSWQTTLGSVSSIGLFTPSKAGNGIITGSYTFGSTTKSVNVNALVGYSKVYLRAENNRVNVYAQDSAGTEFPVTYYDSISYSVTGTGNAINSDGTLVQGAAEGTYSMTATLEYGSTPITATGSLVINKGGPTIQATIDEQDLKDGLVISNKPKLSISLSDGNGVASVNIYFDGTQVSASNIKLTAQDTASTTVSAAYNAATALATGDHTLKIEAQDSLGSLTTISITGLKVYAGTGISGIPVNFPNPFKPSSGTPTTIHYILTGSADIKIMIYDQAGRGVWTQTYAYGTNGGRVGDNTPTWDGKNFSGNIVGNGVYHYFIMSAGKVIGTGQIAVLD